MDKFVIRRPRNESDGSASATQNVTSVGVNSTPSPENLPRCKEETKSSSTVKSTSPGSSLNKKGRSYKESWKSCYSWIDYDRESDKVTCSVCKSAYKINATLQTSSIADQRALNAFVTEGFSSWQKALERFKMHERSSLHRSSVLACSFVEKGVNVAASMSNAKQKEMQTARVALVAIVSSLKFLVQQGLAIRGHEDESSNLYQLLLLRANDLPELKSWLQRTKYKWISHDILNEIIGIMSHIVQNELLKHIREAVWYSLIIDETCDISTTEQVSFCFRVVDSSLKIQEIFLGLYETGSTTSEVLFDIVKDVLTRFNLEISDCRGQCYDGAANVSGCLNGLQSKVSEVESKAIFVHCVAHTLNLVVQDSLQNIHILRDYLALVRELIYFVRHSPKRLTQFNSLQDDQHTSLRPFCPTRWCMRVSSLKTVEANYDCLLEFLKELATAKTEVGAKASGFLLKLSEFEGLFLLKMLILIFERVESLNAALQRKSLHLHGAKESVEILLNSMKTLRNHGFDLLWESVKLKAEELDLNEPVLPRRRKAPRRIDDGSEPYVFETPQEKYRIVFFETVDRTVNSLRERFQEKVMLHLGKLESFATEKTVNSDYIVEFYGADFDKEKLVLHRDMCLDVARSKDVTLQSIGDVVNFLGGDGSNHLRDILTEYVKLIRLILTIPVSTCTAERSFSALRRLKTYLRSTMGQKRLNHLVVLHINKNLTYNLDNDSVVNNFIGRTSIRLNTFYMVQKEHS